MRVQATCGQVALLIFLLPAITVTSGLAQTSVSPDPAVVSMLDQVSQTKLWDDLGGLTGVTPLTIGGVPYTLRTRYTFSGTPIQKATQYAFERCAAAGLSPSYQIWYNRTNPTVICEKRGTTKVSEIVLITAHIDAVSGSPGADDDATGAIAVLTAADLMSSRTFDRTLRFVLFSGEESSLLGSRTYANSVRSETVVAVLNLEMLGWDNDGQPTFGLYTRPRSDPQYAADQSIADVVAGVVWAYGLPLLPDIRYDFPAEAYEADQMSFWEAGVPAILAVQDYPEDFTPYYHSASDTRAHLNMQYYTSLVKTVVASAAHLAGVSPSACTPLAAPLNLYATATSSSAIDLTWAPLSEALQYRLYRSATSGGPYILLSTVTAPSTSFTDMNLPGNTTYYYVVRSVGASGSSCESPNSNEALATTFPPPPPPSATLKASPSAIQLGATSVLSWQTTDATTASLSGIGPVTLTGSLTVSPALTQTYVITATGLGGTTTASATITVGQPPAAPTYLTATLLSGPKFLLSWRDNSTNETGFIVERCSGVSCSAFAQIATTAQHTSVGSVTYTDGTVVSGGSYTYRVKAINGGMSSPYSNLKSVSVPGPPAAPTNLACRAVAAGSTATITCTWVDASNNETGFEAQAALNSTFTVGLDSGTVGANRTSIVGYGMSRATEYWCRVRAMNAAGASAWSNVVSLTTP